MHYQAERKKLKEEEEAKAKEEREQKRKEAEERMKPKGRNFKVSKKSESEKVSAHKTIGHVSNYVKYCTQSSNITDKQNMQSNSHF